MAPTTRPPKRDEQASNGKGGNGGAGQSAGVQKPKPTPSETSKSLNNTSQKVVDAIERTVASGQKDPPVVPMDEDDKPGEGHETAQEQPKEQTTTVESGEPIKEEEASYTNKNSQLYRYLSPESNDPEDRFRPFVIGGILPDNVQNVEGRVRLGRGENFNLCKIGDEKTSKYIFFPSTDIVDGDVEDSDLPELDDDTYGREKIKGSFVAKRGQIKCIQAVAWLPFNDQSETESLIHRTWKTEEGRARYPKMRIKVKWEDKDGNERRCWENRHTVERCWKQVRRVRAPENIVLNGVALIKKGEWILPANYNIICAARDTEDEYQLANHLSSMTLS